MWKLGCKFAIVTVLSVNFDQEPELANVADLLRCSELNPTNELGVGISKDRQVGVSEVDCGCAESEKGLEERELGNFALKRSLFQVLELAKLRDKQELVKGRFRV